MINFKKGKGVFATILVTVFMISVITSCSSNEEINKDDISYSQLSKKYKGIYKKMAKDMGKIQSILLKSKTAGDIEVTQELVDQYARELGYQPGEFNVQVVKDVITERNRTENLGLEALVESKDLSTFAKRKIIELSKGVVLTESEITEEFMNLSSSEKEMIAFGNVYLEEVIAENEIYYGKGMYYPSHTEVVGGIVLGAMAGELFCGPPCALGGAVVGLALSFILK
jgi:hypothetical protein